MEKWKVMTAAAAVGVAVVGGLAVSTSVVAADRTAVSSSGSAAAAAAIGTFCGLAQTRGAVDGAATQCAKPH